MMDLLTGQGIAAGGPVTNGDLRNVQARGQELDDPQPAEGPREATAALEACDWDAPWPKAPANPDLLDPAADPPVPSAEFVTRHADDPAAALPLEPPPEVDGAGDPRVDPEHERLRPYWLAGFDQLSRRRQTGAGVHDTQGAAMPGPRRGVIDLQMSLDTLMGLDDLPAELSGFGPLLADIARQVVAQQPDLQLRFSVYNERNALVAHGTTKVRPPNTPGRPFAGRRTKRRPSAEVAAWVRARNRTCYAPGCRVPSSRCELDHTVAWSENGQSEPENLGPGCKRHHRLKHSPGCHLVQLHPGTFGWRTPLGMRYMTKARSAALRRSQISRLTHARRP